ncbi:MAG: aminopeptidase P family N-terminal domain-containing protein, partial [Desulfobacteraceae bacterium]|nr:aminopeptidase P family N-terminal domain-containing protein [Desulfobacteraceae bacterium]
DPHQSEYVTGHWQARAWLTGFTGSAGVAVVTKDKAILWTDFRYWIQALSQIRDTEFILFKSGEHDIPEFHDWIFEHLSPEDVVAIDGQVISRNQEKKYKRLWDGRQIRLRTDLDLIGSVWQNRPALPITKARDFPTRFAGQSRKEKIAKITQDMAASGAGWYVMTGLEDIAWTCNLRGSDVPHNPVNIAFALLGLEQTTLFVHPAKVDKDLAAVLAADGIQMADYRDIYTALEKLPDQEGVLVDPDMVSAALFAAINPGCRIIEKTGPATRFKAVKNDTQIHHLRDTAVKDGVAVTRFLHWLATRNPQEPVSEISAAQTLFELRSQQADFVDNSFAPIMAYEDHSAMCHYGAT